MPSQAEESQVLKYLSQTTDDSRAVWAVIHGAFPEAKLVLWSLHLLQEMAVEKGPQHPYG